jgi:hypothetical protein
MKFFDADSIYNTLLDKLSQNPDWKVIVSDSVVSSVLKAVSESESELARYVEYLYKESKWDTAQNISSIAAAAGQVGYRPSRKKSAQGTLYISADPRIHQVGRTIFKDDFLKGISGWEAPTQTVVFDEDVTITDSKGNSYIMTSLEDLDAYSNYGVNTIVQGVRKSIIVPLDVARALATRSKLDPYIYIPVEIPNCEDANTPATRKFFKVFVNYSTSYEEFRVVDTLHLSTSGDSDVEVYPDLYNRDLLYLKFNSSSTRGKTINLSLGSGIKSIEVQYIETTGSNGNLTNVFEPFVITGLSSAPSLKLYGINFEPVVGGQDEESIYSIKENAPIYYTNNYSVAVKESYESLIKRIDFGKGKYASRVHVYPSTITVGSLQKPVTAISMILPGADDYANDDYVALEKIVNYYLNDLKAPTDILKIESPKYAGFSIGLNCTADRSQVDNISSLKSSMRNYLDSLYGAGSSHLDFNRSVYSSDIVAGVKKTFPALKSVGLEMEAVTKINWNEFVRKEPYAGCTIRTIRLPFKFNSLFSGNKFFKGFKDYRVGSSYVIRFDFMYKQSAYSTLPAYHTTLFVQEDPSRNKAPFYHIKDTTESSSIWSPEGFSSSTEYPDSSYAVLSNSYQYYFKKKVYSDDDFEGLLDKTEAGADSVITTSNTSAGAVDSYLIAFAGSEDVSDGTVGEGYIEIDIMPLWTTLSRYAQQDTQLAELLSSYNASNLRCGANANSDVIKFVTTVLSRYVDIYVSLRPIDSDFVIRDDEGQKNAVLYVDTLDNDSDSAVLTNLSRDKSERLISVECSLV